MNVFSVVGVLFAFAVLLLFFGIAQLAAGGVDERMGRYVSRARAAAETAPGRESVFRRLDAAMARRGLVEGVRRDLLRADLPLTVPEYLVINVMVVVAGALIGYLISRFWVSALVLAMGSAILPTLYVRLRQRQRIRAFNNQLEDVLNLIVAAMRAGYSLLQSFDYVSRRLPDPAATQFARVVREVSLGLSMDEALGNLLIRAESEDLELIATAIAIHNEVGGNLTIILESVSHTIRERVRIKREIRSLTAMQRGSAYILVALPFVVGGILFVMSPTYMMRLFEPGPTLCIPLGAVVCMAVGFVITRRIMDIEV
jgi:tight adherence protein B